MITRIFLTLSIFSFFSASCQNKGENCIYLIPKGYEGNVMIIFDQSNGKDVLYEGKSRIYQIDTNGVLRTKFKKNNKLSQADFYTVNQKGIRKMVKLYEMSQSLVQDSTEVYCYQIEPGSDFDKDNNKNRYFEIFTIAKPKNADSIIDEKSKFMWKNLANTSLK